MSDPVEWVPRPTRGRLVTVGRRVQLGDAGPSGRLRPDAVVRFLQDVAADDVADAGFPTGGAWVVRRTALRVRPWPGGWPSFGQDIAVTTWAAGAGRAWAERRTDVVSEGGVIEATALWVHLDAAGRPSRFGPEFDAVYGEAIDGRVASPRLPASPAPPPDGLARPWVTRAADLDIAGHVNNAAVWQAVTEIVGDRPLAAAWVAHHAPIAHGEDVLLHTDRSGRLWLTVDGEVRVAASIDPGC